LARRQRARSGRSGCHHRGPLIDRLELRREAPALWNIYPNADRLEVEALIAAVAGELGRPVPPLIGEPPAQVALPPHPSRVGAALDTVRPDWREAALIHPPSGVVAVPIHPAP
jgi:hypothetical protein